MDPRLGLSNKENNKEGNSEKNIPLRGDGKVTVIPRGERFMLDDYSKNSVTIVYFKNL